MSQVTEPQPDGTPTWIDLGVPDLERAQEFYGAVFGWEYDEAGPPEMMRYTICRLDGKAVAALAETDASSTTYWWQVHFATSDCDAAAQRVTDAGGTVVMAPDDVMDQGRMAIAKDPVGAQFGLWQAKSFVGCEVVNEPGALLRNDLVTPDPGPARTFYASVFDFTLDGNEIFPTWISRSCAVPTVTRSAGSWACSKLRRPRGERCSRSPMPTRPSPRSKPPAAPSSGWTT